MRLDVKKTTNWRKDIQEIEDIDSLRQLVDEMTHSTMTWSSFLKQEIISRGLRSYKAFAQKAGVDEKTIGNWINKNMYPKSRRSLIATAMAFSMTEEETNYILVRFGGYPKLYVKNLEDAVCLYVIRCMCHGTDRAMTHKDYPYGYVKELMKKVNSLKAAHKLPKGSAGRRPTATVYDSMNEILDDDRFLRYVENNICDFVPYVTLANELDRLNEGSTHSLVQADILPPKFDTLLSRLRSQHDVLPRDDLIALGIANDMNVEMIDALLEEAKMDILRANRKDEMILIYAIGCAHLNNIRLDYDAADDILSKTGNEGIREACNAVLEEAKNIDMDHLAKSDYSSVGEYVRYVFDRLNMPEAIEKYCTTAGIVYLNE